MRARVPRLLDTRAREGPQGVRSQIPGSKPAAFRFPSVSIQHETFNYYRNYISLFDVIGIHSPMINPMSTNVGSLGGQVSTLNISYTQLAANVFFRVGHGFARPAIRCLAGIVREDWPMGNGFGVQPWVHVENIETTCQG